MRDTRGVRASGLQGEAFPAIVEIIDDDTNVFGDRASNTRITDGGGPRWIAPVAAAALVALMGYSVVTSSSSSGVPKVAPPTTNFLFATTVPATKTTVAPPPVPYYAAEPPRQFSVGYADFQKLDQSYYGNDKYQLWATDGSSASSGSWFSIDSNRAARELLYATDAYRVQSGDQSIAISHTPTGQAIAHFNAHQTTAVTVTAFGWSDEDLVRLAQSITVDGDTVGLSDPSLTTGYQMISSVQPLLALQGIPLEQITYDSTDDVAGGINVTVSPRLASGAGGSTLDREIAQKYFLDQPTTFDVDGHVAIVGSVIAAQDFAVATWIAGDHIVTLTSAMPVQQLMSIAQTVHQVSLDVWNGMKFQATKHNADNNFGNVDLSTPAPVSSGTDGDSQDWTIQVALAKYPHEQQVMWGWDGKVGPGIVSRADDTAKIHTVVDNQRTYVLADLPRAIAATAQLLITRAGLDPVAVSFADTDPSFDRTFAAYAFSEPAQYTAQIVGPDGTVLATWPSP
jgi:hypothetical protein